MSRDVLLGVVIGAQGLAGEVRVKTFTGEPEHLAAYGPLHTADGRRFKIVKLRHHKVDAVIVEIDGISSREAAESLKGVELYVTRGALPQAGENEFYHADLIGLHAEDEQGRELGEIRAVHNFGAGDVLEIARVDGGNLFLSFTKETVPVIDLAERRVVIAEQRDDEALKRRGVE
jgi:16S rRNA processing protein RimM